MESSMQVLNVRMGVNYGLNEVRFISPVPVNSRLRAHLKLLDVLPVDNGGVRHSKSPLSEREPPNLRVWLKPWCAIPLNKGDVTLFGADAPVLPPGLQYRYGDCVGEVQAALIRPHRQAQAALRAEGGPHEIRDALVSEPNTSQSPG